MPEGWSRVETERGGLATCHEPGQLVGYLVMDASALGARRLVESLEEGLIGWLSSQGIRAERRKNFHGVWVGNDKIAALGLHMDRGFTMHGIAINLCNDLEGFRLITPCGITDGGVTSLRRLQEDAPGPEAAAASVAAALQSAIAAALDACRTAR